MENLDNSTKEQLLKEIDQLKADIDKLKKCHSKRDMAEEQLDAIYQNAPFMMILVDEERRVRKVNGATVDFTDVLEEEMLGLRGGEALRCLHHTDDPKGCGFGPACEQCMIKQTVLDTFRTGDSYNHIEAKLPFLIDGEEQELTLLMSTVMLKNTAEPLVLVTIDDITKQKQSEQVIQESNSLLTSIIESPDNIIMFALDTDYNYLSFNQAHAKEMKFIYDADIEIGKHIIDYIPSEEDRAKMLINYKRVLKGERFILVQEYGEADSRFWYELIFNPIYDESKNVTGFTVFVTNITERKLTEEALRESEKILTDFIKSATDGIVLYDSGLNLLEINKNALEIFPGGTTRDKMIGKNILEISPSLKETERYDKYLNVIKTGESLLLNDMIPDPKIGDRHIILNAFKVGQGLGIIFTDNTEHKKSALRIERFSRIFEDSLNEIYLFDADTLLFKQVNNAAIINLGYSMAELQKMTPLDFKPEFTIESFTKLVIPLRKSEKKEIIFETVHQRKDKSLYDVEVHLQLLHFENESIFAAIILDITERKQFDKELTHQKQKLADILEGTNAGTWNWNIITGELSVDERWAEIMGYTVKELEPIDVNTWINNVHPDDLPAANDLLNKHFNKDLDYYDVEFRQPHKNGSWIWVNARGKVIEWTDEGKPVRISGTHLDITNRKQAENELAKHREYLEEMVSERTKELNEKNKKLDDAMKVFVGREMTIRNLQDRIKALGGK